MEFQQTPKKTAEKVIPSLLPHERSNDEIARTRELLNESAPSQGQNDDRVIFSQFLSKIEYQDRCSCPGNLMRHQENSLLGFLQMHQLGPVVIHPCGNAILKGLVAI